MYWCCVFALQTRNICWSQRKNNFKKLDLEFNFKDSDVLREDIAFQAFKNLVLQVLLCL